MAGKYPFAMDWIVFLVFLEDRELPLASVLWLVRIESKDDIMKPINSHSRRRANSNRQIAFTVLCDVRSTDRSKTFYLLVCPREPEEASAKQAWGKISEIVSESKV